MNHIIRIAQAALAALIVAGAFGFDPSPVRAQDAAVGVQLSIKNHRFEPAEIRAPAGTRITLRIRNLDPTPMEFESVTLRVEKVVAGSSEGVINIRPLTPGRYKFFDDFNQLAQGVLNVQ